MNSPGFKAGACYFKAWRKSLNRSYKFKSVSGFFIIVCDRNEKIDPVLCINDCRIIITCQ